jgi:glutathione S-transferase
MPPGDRRDWRRKIPVHVGVDRARQVLVIVACAPVVRTRKVEAAVEDPQSRLAQPAREVLRLDQGSRGHLPVSCSPDTAPQPRSVQSSRRARPGLRPEGGPGMALELYWGSGSPYSWRVLLALEHKRLPYESRLLQFSKQEHKSPQMLRMNPRGRVPVLKDGDYVVFESLACLMYLDRKYPEPPLFGRTPEEAGTIMRVICEYQAYAESHLMQIVSAAFLENIDERVEEVTRATHLVAGEARPSRARSATRLAGRAASRPTWWSSASCSCCVRWRSARLA